MAMHETEFESAEFGEMGEFHEAELQESEQFLNGILGTLGGGGEVSPLTEAQEAELAAELLEISSEEELEQFLDGLIKKVGGFVRSPVGRAIGGMLKNVARKALPVVGGALGSMVAPGIGTTLGSGLGQAASSLFEVELEALPHEHAEFEVARRLVGLTAAAARNGAAARARRGIGPQTLARAAVARAARFYAPGLHRQMMRSLRMGKAGHRRRAQPGIAASGRPGPAPVAGRRPYGRPDGAGYEPVYGGHGAVPGDDGMEPTFDDPADWTDADSGDSGEPGYPMGGAHTSGRWVRRGRKILLLGV